ncbi:MAG: GGDEF domain-containing protein [Clostridia bacterium]|nr:GGDEF domain-containing protein [Clostridia bacterium]
MNFKKFVRMAYPIVLILLMVVFMLLYSVRNIAMTKSQYETRLQETGHQLADEIQLHMKTSVSFVEAFAEVFSEYEDIHSAEALDTLQRVSKKTDFTRMWLTKANGDAISSEGKASNALGRAYLENGLMGLSGISEVQYSNVNGERNVVIYAPIYQKEKITGLIIGIYRLDELSQIIDITCFEGHGHCSIFLPDGEVIVNSENTKSLYGTNLLNYWNGVYFDQNQSLETIKNDLKYDQDGIISYQKDGYFQYGYYYPVGINDWFTYVSLPEDVVTKEYYNNIISTIIICCCVVVVLTLFLVNTFHKKNKRLVKLAQTDSMTELLNRGALEKMIDAYLSESETPDSALLLFDIDKFKHVNDTLGHIVGDTLLKRVALLMSEEFRKEDVLGRLGGDEFVIFIKNAANDKKLKNKANDFLDKLRLISDELDVKIDISGSMGIAFSPRDGKTFAQLYSRADELMYQAKDRGGDCVVTM